ncbi:MAG: molybdenum cofactor biosynthesis protein B [Deltaproteobacteria bacterium]|nr:molybdenum cofactor biosynthesis protein B [Deltaproteobacteria bacterium]
MLNLEPPPPPAGPTPQPVGIAVLTVSDTRTPETDTSGALLVERLLAAGHLLRDRALLPDDGARVAAQVIAWCSAPDIQVVLVTGGTGLTGRDVTVDSLERLYDKAIPGFGELFRMLSWADIGPSTIQSRASGGLVRERLVFCLPGSTAACRLAWDAILAHQLDVRSKPCNLVALMPRFGER